MEEFFLAKGSIDNLLTNTQIQNYNKTNFVFFLKEKFNEHYFLFLFKDTFDGGKPFIHFCCGFLCV